MSRVDGNDLAGDQPIEEHADGGQVLLDGALGMRLAELLDVAGDMNRLDRFERQVALFTPIRKFRDGAEVRLARVPVPDVGGEKLPEAPAGGRRTGKQHRHVFTRAS